MKSLPLDIYTYLFTIWRFHLRNLINLSSVSKNLRKISLSEENWYIISDTQKILSNFIRRIFQSEVSYPVNKILRMHTSCRDVFNILHFIPKNDETLIKFYKHFSNYQFLCMNGILNVTSFCNRSDITGVYINCLYLGIEVFRQCPTLEKIMLTNNITEIIAPNNSIDCNDLIKCCPQIEKIDIYYIIHLDLLKQTRLKYLRINCSSYEEQYTKYLPNTIETCIIRNVRYSSRPIYIDGTMEKIEKTTH
jgi:hypothetical protein